MRPASRPLRPALAAALAVAAAACAEERPPDVVLIVVDTLRADHLSLYGAPRETSPAIDAWAEGGVVFDRHWVGSSWTLPSMAMLFTGRVRSDNSGDFGPADVSLADRFHAAGYRTEAVVSNPLLSERLGWSRSFDGYQLVPVTPGRRNNGWTAGEVVDRGLAALEAAGDEPVFLFLMPFDPHDPYAPEGGLAFEPFDDPGRRAAFERALPPADRWRLDDAAYAGIEERIALYDSEVAQVDRALGRLFEALAEREPEPLVVLTADHGEGLWQRAHLEGENFKEHAFFPWLYFDHGVMLHSEQVHVPLVVRGPGVPARKRIDADTWALDVAPTLARLANLPDAGGFDGVDLFDEGAVAARREIAAFTSRGASLLLDGRHRLHEPREYRVERFDAEPELYDLVRDPLELEPLDDADLRLDLERRLAAWRARGEGDGGTASDDELLRALGYTAGEAAPAPTDARGDADGERADEGGPGDDAGDVPAPPR